MATRVQKMGLTTKERAFVLAFDGDAASTAETIGMPVAMVRTWIGQDWFIEALQERNEREARQLARQRQAYLGAVIAGRDEVLAFWSEVMCDDQRKDGDRLKASEYLAKTMSMLTERVAVEGGDENKPIRVASVDLEERIRLLAVKTVKAPTPDFLE